jgi:sugar phosphate isomerase/epimerase
VRRRAFLEAAFGGAAAALAACAGSSAASSPGAAAGGEAGAAAAGPAAAGAAAAPGARVPALQLYTVRSLMERDVEGTLRTVAGIGYREVEFAGYFRRQPAALRATLDALGLRAPSAHVPLDALRASLPATLDAAAALGHAYLVCPFLVEADRTADRYHRLAAEFTRIGRACQARGIVFAYHNHDFEFLDLGGGRTGYDILLAESDPAVVKMELDLYWATKAGRDPVALFAAHPGRFPLCHVKDMRDPRGARAIAAVGEGSIDFARIFARAPQAGLRHYFVEHDNAPDPVASARTSFGALRRLLA